MGATILSPRRAGAMDDSYAWKTRLPEARIRCGEARAISFDSVEDCSDLSGGRKSLRCQIKLAITGSGDFERQDGRGVRSSVSPPYRCHPEAAAAAQPRASPSHAAAGSEMTAGGERRFSRGSSLLAPPDVKITPHAQIQRGQRPRRSKTRGLLRSPSGMPSDGRRRRRASGSAGRTICGIGRARAASPSGGWCPSVGLITQSGRTAIRRFFL